MINHRRALIMATDSALCLFLVMTIGVVLWTTDEMLDWNILPDWIDAFARLLVIILSVLTGFAVIMSVMCSFAVIAMASADHAGIPVHTASRRTRVLATLGVLLSLAVMMALQQLDEHREAKRVAVQREEHRQRFLKDQSILQSRIPGILAGFSPELCGQLTSLTSETKEAEVARLLKAIQASTPLTPEVTVMLPGAPPYSYHILSALAQPIRVEANKTSFLAREDLIDLPSTWERDTVAALFTGQTLTVPSGRRGRFIDTRKPAAWGLIQTNGTVIAIVMLQAP